MLAQLAENPEPPLFPRADVGFMYHCKVCDWVQVLARACAPEKTQHTPEQAEVAKRLVKELGPFADQENALDDLGCCNDVSPTLLDSGS